MVDFFPPAAVEFINDYFVEVCMDTKKECPDCQGVMILLPGCGGLFWRCQKCGKKLPLNGGDLKECGCSN